MILVASATINAGTAMLDDGCWYQTVGAPVLLKATEDDGLTPAWYIVGVWQASAATDSLILFRDDGTPAIMARTDPPINYFRPALGVAPITTPWTENLTPLHSDGMPTTYYAVNFKYTRGPIADADEHVGINTSQESVTTIAGTAQHMTAGTSMEYRWLKLGDTLSDWTAVGADGAANLSLATLAVPLGLGTHTLTLEVRDAAGLTASDNMTLTVSNTPPSAQPAPSTQAVEIYMDAIIIAAEVADFDGDTLTYEWVKDGVVLDSGTVSTPAGGAEVAIPDLAIAARDSRFPLGLNEVELVVSDGVNEPVSVTASVDVQDTRAPTLCPIPSRIILLPPDGQLKPVTIWANVFDRGGGPTTLSVTVESSRPPASGQTDYVIDSIDNRCDVIHMRLRAERRIPGVGRIYKITVTATDQGGNQSSAILLILAPRFGLCF
jgi:hypothetical protein